MRYYLKCTNPSCKRKNLEISSNVPDNTCSECGSPLQIIQAKTPKENIITGVITGALSGGILAGASGAIIGAVIGSAIATGINEKERREREW